MPLPLPPLAPLMPRTTKATPMQIRPGMADLRTFFGGAGRPDSAVTTGTRDMALAGRDAANQVASTASPMAGPITAQGSANGAIT